MIDVKLLEEFEAKQKNESFQKGRTEAVDEFIFRIKNRKLFLEDWQWKEINQIAEQIKEQK